MSKAGPDFTHQGKKIEELAHEVKHAAHEVSTAANDAASTIADAINSATTTLNTASSSMQNAVAGAINATTFPVLTEEVGYPPSPVANPRGPSAGGGGSGLGQVATKALSDVLGWKLKTDDPKSFLGALNASFNCTQVEGHSVCTWQPRSFAVQTDLSGGITGAQASIYSRAQNALGQVLPLLDGLYPLNPSADQEDVAAYREVVRTQLQQLVAELAYVGGPRVYRVDQYFGLLLGANQLNVPGYPPYTPYTPGTSPNNPPRLGTANSDLINGSLGNLRDLYAIFTQGPTPGINNVGSNPYINSIADEQDTANFRIISDYLTSLALSWLNNYQFFGLGAPQATSLGPGDRNARRARQQPARVGPTFAFESNRKESSDCWSRCEPMVAGSSEGKGRI